jgi:uncharacterized protein (DUF1800 family)
MALDLTTSLAQLFRRLAFGATSSELESAARAGYAATAASLIGGLTQPDPGADAVALPSFTPPPDDLAAIRSDPAARRQLEVQLAEERVELMSWWIARMVGSTNPAREKLTLLLHAHFPTGISKVRYALYMYGQNQIFRTQGAGDFAALTQAVSTDPAMLIWLDAASDKASDPNENFARELMERFTMGIGTYTQADVRAAAYCFTGWRFSAHTGQFSIAAINHSDVPQTFLGQTGITAGSQVIDLVTQSEASYRFIPSSFWSLLAYPTTTSSQVVADLAPGYAANRNMAQLLQAIVTHPDFVSTTTGNGLIKQPVEYVVGTLRALNIPATALGTTSLRQLVNALAEMGQVPFDPPSVGGWGQNTYWLSTAAALVRWRFANKLAGGADISLVADSAPSARVEATGQLLSIPTWSSTTASKLRRAPDPATMVALALVAPEHVSN